MAIAEMKMRNLAPAFLLAPVVGVLAVESPTLAVFLTISIVVVALQSAILVAQVSLLATFCAGAISLTIPGTGLSATFVSCLISLVLVALKFVDRLHVRGLRQSLIFAAVTIGSFGISLLIAGPPATLGGVAEQAAYLIVFLLVVCLALHSPASLRFPIAGAALFHAAVGGIEFFSARSIFYTTWKGEDAARIGPFLRAASTVGDPNYLALTLLCLGMGAIYLGAREPSAISRRAGFLALAVLPLTFSRAGLIGLALTLTALYLTQRTGTRSRAILVIFTSVSLAALVPNPLTRVLFDRVTGDTAGDASVNQRLAVQDLAIHLLRESPLVGVGPHAFPDYSRLLYDSSRPFDVQTAVLNTYLFAWLSGGVLAFIAFAYLLTHCLVHTFRDARELFAVLVGIAAMILTLDAYTLAPMWAVLGLSIAAASADVHPRSPVALRHRSNTHEGGRPHPSAGRGTSP